MEDMKDKKVEKTVVVLGMHRSGTSLVAGILEKLGVNMGKRQVGIHWSNPLGHYENIDFIKMDDKILKKAGGTWDNPPEISDILRLTSDKKLMSEIEKVVRRNEDVIWGWKVPTTSLTIELYLPFLTNPHFIVCYRDPEAIARSLKERDDMDREKALQLTDYYIRSIKEFFKRHPELKYIEIQYEELIENPKEIIYRLIDFLKINPTQKQINEALSLVLPTEEIEKLQKELKKKEIIFLIKDIVKNPYLLRRYLFRALKNPKYALKKIGLR